MLLKNILEFLRDSFRTFGKNIRKTLSAAFQFLKDHKWAVIQSTLLVIILWLIFSYDLHLSVRGFFLVNQGLYEEAERCYLEMYENESDNVKLNACNYLGIIYTENLDYDKAIHYYHQAIEILKDSPRVSMIYNNIAKAYLEKGAYKEALSSIDKAIQTKIPRLMDSMPRQVVIAMFYDTKGDIYNRMGDYSNALQFYKKEEIIKNHTRLARLQKHTLGKPFNIYEKIGDAHRKRGKAGDIDSSYAYYTKALELNPDNIDVEIALSELYDRFPYDDFNAEQCLMRGDSAYLHFSIRDYNEAIKWYKRAINLSKNDIELARAYSGLGKTYARLGSLRMREYRLELLRARSISSSRTSLSIFKRLNGQSNGFENEYLAEAYLALALSYRLANLPKAALRQAEKAVKYDPSNSEIYSLMGDVLSCLAKDRSQFSRAEKEYKKSLEHDPKFIMSLSNLSLLYFLRGEIDSTMKYLSKAVEIKQDFGLAHFNLAGFHLINKEYKKAETELLEASRCDPAWLYPNIVLCVLYASVYNQSEEAMDILSATIARNPHNKELHAYMSKLYFRIGKIKQGFEELKTSILFDQRKKYFKTIFSIFAVFSLASIIVSKKIYRLGTTITFLMHLLFGILIYLFFSNIVLIHANIFISLYELFISLFCIGLLLRWFQLQKIQEESSIADKKRNWSAIVKTHWNCTLLILFFMRILKTGIFAPIMLSGIGVIAVVLLGGLRLLSFFSYEKRYLLTKRRGILGIEGKAFVRRWTHIIILFAIVNGLILYIQSGENTIYRYVNSAFISILAMVSYIVNRNAKGNLVTNGFLILLFPTILFGLNLIFVFKVNLYFYYFHLILSILFFACFLTSYMIKIEKWNIHNIKLYTTPLVTIFLVFTYLLFRYHYFAIALNIYSFQKILDILAIFSTVFVPIALLIMVVWKHFKKRML